MQLLFGPQREQRFGYWISGEILYNNQHPAWNWLVVYGLVLRYWVPKFKQLFSSYIYACFLFACFLWSYIRPSAEHRPLLTIYGLGCSSHAGLMWWIDELCLSRILTLIIKKKLFLKEGNLSIIYNSFVIRLSVYNIIINILRKASTVALALHCPGRQAAEKNLLNISTSISSAVLWAVFACGQRSEDATWQE